MLQGFGMLEVRRVIVHDVPLRTGPRSGELVLSTIESRITQTLANYIREKITGSLNSAFGFPVVFLPDPERLVPIRVRSYMTGEMEFIPFSQDVARHLFDIQTGSNSPGLLLVAECRLDDRPSIAIVKLEREAGLRLQPSEEGGERTYNIEHIRELMMTRNTRVFKAGLFKHLGQEGDEIAGIVSDHQRGPAQTDPIAEFFLNRFLGCMLTVQPSVATQALYEASEAWINVAVGSPERKAHYQLALLVEMKSEQDVFHAETFAAHHLALNDRQAYLNYLHEHEVPVVATRKDTSLIERRISAVQLSFSSGISIVVPQEVYEDRVRVIDQNDGIVRVEIEDQLKNVRGGR